MGQFPGPERTETPAPVVEEAGPGLTSVLPSLQLIEVQEKSVPEDSVATFPPKKVPVTSLATSVEEAIESDKLW
ncbi:hypothetical protein NDU88_001265 [Pleurodeles waltl]|uniref:Uncharacterized protein n=1 Tax=Pleurodeles waltl TaxID=8319 RepID=A0AAV7SYR6_PLEWA|nr:hypothetical protein NDU88_001265 [Pleurodeles waltl]